MGVRGVLKKLLGQPDDTARAMSWVPSQAGESISEDRAMRIATVHACVKVLSEDVAALPLNVYRRLPDGGKEKATEHPLYNLLRYSPNPDMTAMAMRESMMMSLLLYGNAYAYIAYRADGRVAALYPLHPSEVTPVRAEDGTIFYHAGGESLRQEEVLHVMGLSFDGLVGLSPIAYARESLGLSAAAEKFGAKFFRDGTHLGGVISVQGKMDDGGFERTRAGLQAMYTGMQHAHGVLLLEGGATFQPVGIPPEDAQFLETRKFQRSDIAAIYRVPPHLIGDLERATFSNIEHQDLAYLQRALLPWLVRWEQAVRARLFSPREQGKYFAEHDTGSFMRGDTGTRMQAYALAVNSGIFTINEVRAKENMNPVKGGDQLRVPLNMTAADDSGQLQGQGGKGRRMCRHEHETRAGLAEDDDEEAGAASPERVKEAEEALSFVGVTAEQYRALSEAIEKWLAGERAAIAALVQQALQYRSAQVPLSDKRLKLLDAVEDYYRKVDGQMPDSLRDAVGEIARSAYDRATVELGKQAPDMAWFRRKLGYYFGDSMKHMQDGLRGEVTRLINSAAGEDAELMDKLQRKLARWGKDKAYAMAKTQAAMAENNLLVRTYHKAGYHAVWQAAGNCCEMCQRLNHEFVTTLTPPLHPGCGCTVKRGPYIDEHNEDHNPLNIAAQFDKLVEEAKNGGRNDGEYNTSSKYSDKSLKKAIRSTKKVIEDHYWKIEHPDKADADWNKKDWRGKAGLIRKWQREIMNAEERNAIHEAIMKERNRMI